MFSWRSARRTQPGWVKPSSERSYRDLGWGASGLRARSVNRRTAPRERANDSAQEMMHSRRVPQFLFHLHRPGLASPDEDGMSLSDLKSAVLLAVQLARRFAAVHLREGGDLGYRIEIENADTGQRTIVPFRWAMLGG